LRQLDQLLLKLRLLRQLHLSRPLGLSDRLGLWLQRRPECLVRLEYPVGLLNQLGLLGLQLLKRRQSRP